MITDMPDSAALRDFINMQCFKYSNLVYVFLLVFNFLCCVKSTQCVTGIKYQELFCTIISVTENKTATLNTCTEAKIR